MKLPNSGRTAVHTSLWAILLAMAVFAGTTFGSSIELSSTSLVSIPCVNSSGPCLISSNTPDSVTTSTIGAFIVKALQTLTLGDAVLDIQRADGLSLLRVDTQATATTPGQFRSDQAANSVAFLASLGNFTSQAASGNTGFVCANNGCRMDFGAGASDYASSDGTTVTFAGPLASASDITSTGGRISSRNSNGGFTFGIAGTEYFGMAAGSSRIDLTAGNLNVNSSASINFNQHIGFSSTAPSISSGFGTSPSVTVSNGTVTFRINVGTGGVATSGVIGLPTVTTGWNCTCEDVTTFSTTVFRCRQTATSTTTATIGNFTSAAAAGAWVASDILAVSCVGY